MNFVATEAPEQGNGTVPLFTIGSNYKGDESQEAIRKARKKRYR